MTSETLKLRAALGRFATGVCVITTEPAGGVPIGITANSFASVSLDPPLVLWSLQNSSDVFAEIARARQYAINVLSSEQVGQSLRYASKGEHELLPAHYTPGRHGAPLLRGALACFECEQHATHEGGDHIIIVGRVREVHARPTGNPLLFYGGTYRELH